MFHVIGQAVDVAWLLVRVVVPTVLVTRVIIAAFRFALLPRGSRRYYWLARLARIRWRWMCANLRLSYMDRHRRGVALPGSTKVTTDTGTYKGKVRFPRARFFADEYGWSANVRTVPSVGREQFNDNAAHIADQWKCARVQVSQVKPGRLVVRGLKQDPLTVPYTMAQAPAGVYGPRNSVNADIFPNPSAPRRVRLTRGNVVITGATRNNITGLRLYVGRDEWGNHRWVPLAGITGITVGGLPGYGKTSFINSILCQLAPLPVALVLIDGKGGGDYEDWADRASIFTGDELPAAAAALEDTHGLMRSRFGTVQEVTGHRNAWHAPLSPAFPVVLTILDECHTFFDLEAVKGQKQAEAQVRACRALSAQLVKKGRSVLFITIFITQKQTSDAIPTAIRDNCGLGLSFAVKTKDAAVASLGEQIKEHDSYCPTTLQARPDYIGVCTAALPTGADPFVRLRVPEVTEAAAAARAAETASKRLDPSAVPAPVPVPAAA